ncbi:trypsin-like peptidase domain-containing protein [Streptomyces sp. A5-4]|uniref:trypsin-like peptidase domain-containing protein n=1 Tax=Streptomyces sp. A5-4 TaxID=3384771 RepID=UPI003DA9CA65
MAVRDVPVSPVTLVRICDLAGRPRGTGFVADDRGTVITSHEAVDGLTRVVLHAPGERTCLAEADEITPLPEMDLALVRTEGLGVRPVPVTARDGVETGTYVRLVADGWRDARVLGPASVTYTATDRFHLVDCAVELAIGTAGSDALRLGGEATGGPVVDAGTGAVLAVLGTALQSGRRGAGFAVPLREAAATDPHGPLAELLRRNAATVPGYGRDLNLAGALQLTATCVGSVGGPSNRRDPVERPDVTREFVSFEASDDSLVLGLVGDPGSGRTTELAALAARRAQGAEPAPTLWLRGADLRAGDRSVADAMARALRQAGRIVAASGERDDPAPATPERVARLACDAGRPLLVLLDGPEEMPPALAHRLPEWAAGTASWLRTAGVRLVVACRPEHWEQAGELFPRGALHRPGRPARRLPAAVRVGDLSARQAQRARKRYGIGDTALAQRDARHPLTLRLLAEVRDALPEDVGGRPGRDEVFAAHLDLMCLRVAVRLAAAARPSPRGTAVRRLAARVSGQVHEAARRCLGPGQGELDRESFEEIFPWRTGWASAVLTEGLLVPAGGGYRFAHEEFADWLQGAHLDVDVALHALVHRERDDLPGARDDSDPGVGSAPGTARAPVRLPSRPAASPRPGPPHVPPPPGSHADTGIAGEADGPRSLPVPRHRIGPVVQALLLLGRDHGPAALTRRLEGLIDALDSLKSRPNPATEAVVPAAPAPAKAREPAAGGPAETGAPTPVGSAGTRDPVAGGPVATRTGDACWWAAHLLGEALLRVVDTESHLPVLRHLADRVTGRSLREGGPEHLGGFAEFGPWFWEALRVEEAERVDLLRRLVPADGAPGGSAPQERYLDAVARLLADGPGNVQPLLCRWFDDERPLPAADGAAVRPTVAGAAQALLYARRELAIDDLTETLVDCAHPRADELLAALAEDEPSALCRAVDRWAHDAERPDRRVAAAAYGPATAPHVTSEADFELLRYAALSLLARPADATLHGRALALLVRDPHTRSQYLPEALAAFAADEPQLPASALTTALLTHPEPVLAAFQARLARGGEPAGEVLRALADVNTPALARRAAALVREYVDRSPEGAAHAAAYVDRRMEHGPACRAVLFPLVTSLLRGRPVQVRRALAPVLAAPGSRASRPLRAELLDVLMEYEQYEARDLAVLDALLCAAALGAGSRAEARTRDLVHRTGLLLVRTPEGATCFDRRLVELAREVPGFAALVAGWLAEAPQEWAVVIGPSARRTVETLSDPMPMRAAGVGHGSLRPA